MPEPNETEICPKCDRLKSKILPCICETTEVSLWDKIAKKQEIEARIVSETDENREGLYKILKHVEEDIDNT